MRRQRFTDDHTPAHVHVTSADYEVKIDISGAEATVLKSSKKRRYNADAKFIKKALSIVNSRFDEVKAAWSSIHGQ